MQERGMVTVKVDGWAGRQAAAMPGKQRKPAVLHSSCLLPALLCLCNPKGVIGRRLPSCTATPRTCSLISSRARPARARSFARIFSCSAEAEGRARGSQITAWSGGGPGRF